MACGAEEDREEMVELRTKWAAEKGNPMRTELWVRCEFEAAHDLTGVFPATHKCSRLHGHRYAVTLTITSTSEEDVIVDYHELHEGLRDILKHWDHTNLQETFNKPSTCENLAREIYYEACGRWPGFVSSVEVQEQRDTGCRILLSSSIE